MSNGLITSIQRYSLHDGPGIRTTVFFKGCQLTCPWCHNPETISCKPELLFYADKCSGCRKCLGKCQTGAQKAGDNGQHVLDRNCCAGCFECAEVCYPQALQVVGRYKSVKEVLDEVIQDISFYKNTTGGITLSGGEPFLQIDFAEKLLSSCKKLGIHTAVETNLAFAWNKIARIVPLVDLWIVDIKYFDSHKHKELTGVENNLILQNIEKLGELKKKLIVRTVLIKDLTDSVDNLRNTLGFLKSLESVEYFELLTYHPLGVEKKKAMRDYQNIEVFKAPTDTVLQEFISVVRSTGIRVYLDGKAID